MKLLKTRITNHLLSGEPNYISTGLLKSGMYPHTYLIWLPRYELVFYHEAN